MSGDSRDESSFDEMVDEEYGNEFEEKSNGKSNENHYKTKEKEHSKKEITVYKYSKRGKGELYESVIISEKPCFLKYDQQTDKIIVIEMIEEAARTIKPPLEEEYPYESYYFEDIDQVNEYLMKAENETNESLYRKIVESVKKYNDRDNNSINLISLDIFSSYFQDKFSTIHYDFVIGDNGTGKTAIGDTFESLGYRVVMMTDPTPANWFRTLGTIEWGQCTIVADEADRIDRVQEINSILKTGYQKKARVSRMNSTNTKQDFYFPYCFKLMLAESSPSLFTSKGILDRSFIINSYKGYPQYDIKEVRNPQGNPERQRLLDEINELRKLLLVYRIYHFKDPLPEIDVSFDGRDKELTKPQLQLFFETEIFNEIQETLQYFINKKNKKKEGTIEAMVYPIIVNLISKKGREIATSTIWEWLPVYVEGRYDDKNSSIFHSSDHGSIYRNTLIKQISDKFGAEIKHKEGGNVFVFNTDMVVKAGKIYDSKVGIQTKILGPVVMADSPDAPDPSIEGQGQFTEDNDLSNGKNIQKDELKSEKIILEILDIEEK
ncbi:MAG: hypothetical protein DA329_11010 [Candidatus Nitrosocosmicus sp.]|nr:hypothetical protein [Candidatus Nitrosocosmicus sp.]